MTKSILILSNRSSGSSAVQRLLAQAADLKCVEKTRHHQNESLYWTKAASVLGLPQHDMLDSEVPIPPAAARQDLFALLQDNVAGYVPPAESQPLTKALIFDGWRQLSAQFGPVFLEKSPHHLLQQSALSLIAEATEALAGEVEFMLVGLVRNPMDVLYSAFRRWKTPPEALQYEWLIAYQNLQDLAARLGDRVVIVRYEDLVHSLAPLSPIFDFCNAAPSASATKLNPHALRRWRTSRSFGFSLDPEVKALALAYGYDADSLEHTVSPVMAQLWPSYQKALRQFHQSTKWAKALYFQIRQPDWL